ncbi:hypothetical protein ZWY2020_037108 [Hordeum vulgare]|nr:hypothetical protein ZWY2020_037108 [Hordeum vulgare]
MAKQTTSMGFPVGYSELLLPKQLVHLLHLLGYLRRFLLWAFDVVGLDNLLDLGDKHPTTWSTRSGPPLPACPTPPTSTSSTWLHPCPPPQRCYGRTSCSSLSSAATSET